MPSAPEFLAAVGASAIGALVAGAVGYRYALSRFRGERTFDRQLVWYERAVATLSDAAKKLNWAIASERAEMPQDVRDEAWRGALEALLGLRALETEAEMYASAASYDAVSEAVRDVLELVNSSTHIERFREHTTLPPKHQLFEIAWKMLNHAAARLASDVREHLSLRPVSRPVGLYDQDFRELHRELDRLRVQGALPVGDSAPKPLSNREDR